MYEKGELKTCRQPLPESSYVHLGLVVMRHRPKNKVLGWRSTYWTTGPLTSSSISRTSQCIPTAIDFSFSSDESSWKSQLYTMTFSGSQEKKTGRGLISSQWGSSVRKLQPAHQVSTELPSDLFLNSHPRTNKLKERITHQREKHQNREAEKGTQGRRDSAENSKLIKKKLGDQSKRANNELTVGLAQRTEIQEEKII